MLTSQTLYWLNYFPSPPPIFLIVSLRIERLSHILYTQKQKKQQLLPASDPSIQIFSHWAPLPAYPMRAERQPVYLRTHYSSPASGCPSASHKLPSCIPHHVDVIYDQILYLPWITDSQVSLLCVHSSALKFTSPTPMVPVLTEVTPSVTQAAPVLTVSLSSQLRPQSVFPLLPDKVFGCGNLCLKTHLLVPSCLKQHVMK